MMTSLQRFTFFDLSNMQLLESERDLDAQLTLHKRRTSRKQQDETTFPDITHVSYSNALEI